MSDPLKHLASTATPEILYDHEVFNNPQSRSFPGVTLGPFYPADKPDLTITPNTDQTVRVKVNKTTHRVVFEGENEMEVTITIIPKP
jgi:hypothetical protein